MNEMDLKTAITILLQQASQLVQYSMDIQNLANVANTIISEENSIASLNPQIHALTSTMVVVMTAIGSQDVLVQQAIDKVAELSA